MIPNILTTARVAMVPLFAYFMLIENNPYAGALIFVLAGITDVLLITRRSPFLSIEVISRKTLCDIAFVSLLRTISLVSLLFSIGSCAISSFGSS